MMMLNLAGGESQKYDAHAKGHLLAIISSISRAMKDGTRG
jgi:hypothetical protein